MHGLMRGWPVVVLSLLVGFEWHAPRIDGAAEVRAAREKYDADLAAAVDPIRKHFLDRLETLEKDLTRKGDLDGALAARTERERAGMVADVGFWQPFVGTWSVHYDNGANHTYEISRDGTVRYREKSQTLSLRRADKDSIIDFGNGKVERVVPSLTTQMFEDNNYPKGNSFTAGHGKKLEE
jgi:hypothetical protein